MQGAHEINASRGNAVGFLSNLVLSNSPPQTRVLLLVLP